MSLLIHLSIRFATQDWLIPGPFPHQSVTAKNVIRSAAAADAACRTKVIYLLWFHEGGADGDSISNHPNRKFFPKKMVWEKNKIGVDLANGTRFVCI